MKSKKGGVNIPNLGSATTREAFFSSLTEFNRFDNMGETLFSTIAVTSSSAVAALSNFANCFNFNLYTHWIVSLVPSSHFPLLSYAERTSRHSRKQKSNIQASSAFRCAHFPSQIILLKQFLVLGLKESIARTSLGKN